MWKLVMNDLMKGLLRLTFPLRHFGLKYPLKIWGAYARFYRDTKTFRKNGGVFSLRYINPVLSFKNEDTQSGGGHYFFQDIWALRKISELKPTMHYDVGSRFDGFTGQATALCEVTCIDLRKPGFSLPGFYFVEGDILKLPFQNGTLFSLSCLHTIEHIGLGRYGDAINPNGYVDSLQELQRVIAPGGHLLLSMPIGKERTEFNAQRILDPLSCVGHLTEMELVEFSIVSDNDEFLINADPFLYKGAKYCCGLYMFKKK